MELDYKKLAQAIYDTWDGSNGVGSCDYGKVYIGYDIMELEGYEEPCYNVESSRCGPGGYYGLDAYVVTAYAPEEDDFEIDSLTLSCEFTNLVNGDGSKEYIVENYFENN